MKIRMEHLLRLEEVFLFLLSVYLFSRLDYPWWLFPLLLFGHSAMDRALHYGLKYPDRFEHTHLGGECRGEAGRQR